MIDCWFNEPVIEYVILFNSQLLLEQFFLGSSTSLSGIVTTINAASQSYVELAISNAVGGIAAQTAFLAIANIFYRKANLEHAAASIANIIQGTLRLKLLFNQDLRTDNEFMSLRRQEVIPNPYFYVATA